MSDKFVSHVAPGELDQHFVFEPGADPADPEVLAQAILHIREHAESEEQAQEAIQHLLSMLPDDESEDEGKEE